MAPARPAFPSWPRQERLNALRENLTIHKFDNCYVGGEKKPTRLALNSWLRDRLPSEAVKAIREVAQRLQ